MTPVSLIHLFLHLFMHLFYLFFQSLNYSFIHFFIHSFIQPHVRHNIIEFTFIQINISCRLSRRYKYFYLCSVNFKRKYRLKFPCFLWSFVSNIHIENSLYLSFSDTIWCNVNKIIHLDVYKNELNNTFHEMIVTNDTD